MIEAPEKEILLTAAYFEAARTQLHNLAAALCRRMDVADVLAHFAPREYASGLAIETYVEAELGDGRALLWWLEMKGESEYHVESSLALTDDSGQRTLETVWANDATSLSDALRSFATASELLPMRTDVTKR